MGYYKSKTNLFQQFYSNRIVELIQTNKLNNYLNDGWLYLKSSDYEFPKYGWKIHLSLSSSESDIQILFNCIIPCLINRKLTFKIPEKITSIDGLNNGEMGLTQIGKVVTIYPSSDEDLKMIYNDFVHLKLATDGPYVKYDIVDDQNPFISFRYGAFQNSFFDLDEEGKPFQNIQFKGNLILDDRFTEQTNSKFIKHFPFPIKVKKFKPINSYLESNLVVSSIITSNHKRNVYLGIDTRLLQTVVIKESVKNIGKTRLNTDSIALLENEYKVLNFLSDKIKFIPKPYKFDIPNKDIGYLVMEDIQGVHLISLSDIKLKLKYFKKLLLLIHNLHQLNYVHGDIKGTNVLIKNNNAFLIDFELCRPVNSKRLSYIGTRNYFAKEGYSKKVSFGDDLFSLAMLLFHILCDYDPALLPTNYESKFSILENHGYKNAVMIIKNLMTKKMGLDDLIKVPDNYILKKSNFDIDKNIINKLKKGIASSEKQIFAYAREQLTGILWENSNLFPQYYLPGINIGSAGILISLISTNYYNKGKNIDKIYNTAKQLAGTDYKKANGLFSGNGGIALSLAIAGMYLSEKSFITKSIELLNYSLKNNKFKDFFGGISGLIYANCAIAEITKDFSILELSTKHHKRLIDDCVELDSIYCWKSDNQNDGDYLIGAAHGLFGINFAIEKYSKYVDSNFGKDFSKSVIHNYFKAKQGETFINYSLDNSKLIAPSNHWCHGAAGIVWCLLQSPFKADYEEYINQLFSIYEKSPTIDNPTLCHGLAGQLEIIDLCLKFKTNTFLIQRKQEILNNLSIIQNDTDRNKYHKNVWYSGNPITQTPDLWTGFSGTALAIKKSINNDFDPILSIEWLKKISVYGN